MENLYKQKITLRGEIFAGRKFREEKKREILGIYFREWPNEFFSREENFREFRVFRITFC